MARKTYPVMPCLVRAAPACARCIRRWAAVLLCLLGLPALAAEALRISVSLTPLSLPLFVADSEGYFTAEGLNVQLNEVVGGNRSLQQLFDGTAELATCSDTVVMFHSFVRRDYVVIATFVSSDDDLKVVTREDAGIARAQDLAGKRIGTVLRSAGQYHIDTLLILNGVNPKSVHLRDLPPETMIEALRKGEIDALAMWEPFPFMSLSSIPGTRLLPKSGSYVETFNLIAHRKLTGGRDDELVKVLRALDRAQLLIKSDPAKAQAILRERLRVEQAFINWIWPRTNYRLTLGQSLLSTLEGEARWARQEGYVKGDKSPNFLDFIYPAPLRRVRPAGVTMD